MVLKIFQAAFDERINSSPMKRKPEKVCYSFFYCQLKRTCVCKLAHRYYADSAVMYCAVKHNVEWKIENARGNARVCKLGYKAANMLPIRRLQSREDATICKCVCVCECHKIFLVLKSVYGVCLCVCEFVLVWVWLACSFHCKFVYVFYFCIFFLAFFLFFAFFC